jgi:hypothetical protein
MADPRVLRAMTTPLLGQFDPEFSGIMNDVMALCRFAFQTDNAKTFPVSGTGRAGLEAAMASLIEPEDRVVVGECGNFGQLLIEIAERCGAEVVPVRAEWGRVIEPEAIETAWPSSTERPRPACCNRWRRSRTWCTAMKRWCWRMLSSRLAAARWRWTAGASISPLPPRRSV